MTNITRLPPDLGKLAELRLLLRDARAKLRDLAKEIVSLKATIRQLKKDNLDLELKVKALEEKSDSRKQSAHRKSPNWRIV